MRIHRNAKTTPAASAALVHRVLHEDWTYAATAAAFAVSERTVAKWVHRLHVGGADARDVTYTEDVAPILMQHCVTCHRPGEVAPMTLLT